MNLHLSVLFDIGIREMAFRMKQYSAVKTNCPHPFAQKKGGVFKK